MGVIGVELIGGGRDGWGGGGEGEGGLTIEATYCSVHVCLHVSLLFSFFDTCIIILRYDDAVTGMPDQIRSYLLVCCLWFFRSF